MKEILFRGKRVDNGEWVYGYYYESKISGCFILVPKIKVRKKDGVVIGDSFDVFEVIPETVGQFTGLCDKNGDKIFTGDIIYIKCGYGLSAFVGKGIVFFDEKRLQFRVKSVEPSSFDSEKGNTYDECDFTVIDSYEVIGNIYDNKEEEE